VSAVVIFIMLFAVMIMVRNREAECDYPFGARNTDQVAAKTSDESHLPRETAQHFGPKILR
jgi:hypothetical protein